MFVNDQREKTLSRLAKLSEISHVGADGNAEYKDVNLVSPPRILLLLLSI